MSRLRIIIDPGSDFEALRGRYAEAPARVAEGIRAGLDRANAIVLSRVNRDRFTGVGPFPVSEHKLGHRSRRLTRSLSASRAVINDASSLRVASGIGSNVVYFGAHEFGYAGTVTVPAHSREMPEITRTSRGGRQYTVPAHTQSVRSHSRRMKVPMRAPLMTGLREEQNQETFKDEIYTAIRDALTTNP